MNFNRCFFNRSSLIAASLTATSLTADRVCDRCQGYATSILFFFITYQFFTAPLPFQRSQTLKAVDATSISL